MAEESKEKAKLPHVKRLGKGESILESTTENETENTESVETSDEKTGHTVSLPFPIHVAEISETLDSSEEEEDISFSTLLADEAASDQAQEQAQNAGIAERLGIPRPLNGPVTIVQNKYVLLDSMKQRMFYSYTVVVTAWVMICTQLHVTYKKVT